MKHRPLLVEEVVVIATMIVVLLVIRMQGKLCNRLLRGILLRV
jgi:hypothetical protein